MQNRLVRSQTDRMIGGVCSGLGKYLQIEVTIVRLFFLAFTLLGGVGPLVYIILWVVLPSEEKVEPGVQEPQVIDGEEIKDRAEQFRDEFVTVVSHPNQKTVRYIGIALVLAGAYLFVKQLHLPWLAWLDSGVLWAGLILLAGIAFLLRGMRKDV